LTKGSICSLVGTGSLILKLSHSIVEKLKILYRPIFIFFYWLWLVNEEDFWTEVW